MIWWGQNFGLEAPKFGAKGAALENFSVFSEKLLFRNAIKNKNCGIKGLEKNFVLLRKIVS